MTGEPMRPGGDVSMLALCAVRYALGRHSYIVPWVAEAVRGMDLDPGTSRVILRDVADHLDHLTNEERLAWRGDVMAWERLREHLDNRIDS